MCRMQNVHSAGTNHRYGAIGGACKSGKSVGEARQAQVVQQVLGHGLRGPRTGRLDQNLSGQALHVTSGCVLVPASVVRMLVLNLACAFPLAT
jgi:hypothetical protein